MERLVQSFIDMKMDEADAPEIHALLIARHGRLVLEEYFHGFSRDKLHILRSASKSITGNDDRRGDARRCSAPARQPRLPGDERRRVPGRTEPRKRAMTLENLLTMSSGHYCDDTDDKAPGNEDYINDELQPPNVVGYFMSVPMATDPGANSVYCSMQPHLALGHAPGSDPPIAVALLRPAGRPADADHQLLLAARHQRPALRRRQCGDSRSRLHEVRPVDAERRHAGTASRILDASYAKAAVAPQYHLRNIFYGYLWWMEYYPYKGRKVLGYSMRGAGGQVVFVVPELDLVVTAMGGNYSNRRGGRYLNNFIATRSCPRSASRATTPRRRSTTSTGCHPMARRRMAAA